MSRGFGKGRSTAPPPRQVQVRLSQAEIDELCCDYRTGLAVVQLVRKYAVHRTTVMEHLERQGVNRRQNVRKLTDADVRRAARMYKAGSSIIRTAAEFGVSERTMRRELAEAGHVIRVRRGWVSTSSE